MKCSDSSTCTVLGECIAGRFDSDKIPGNGCESIFNCNEIVVQNAVCRECQSSFVCTAISLCEHNRFDSDHDPSNGCESSFDCGTMFHDLGAQCTACSESTCTAISSCNHNRFDSDHDPSNGCESEYNCEAISVTHGKCMKCSDSSTCEKVKCNVNFSNRNKYHEDGCEFGPVVPRIQASRYNNEYGRIALEWSELSFSHTIRRREFCLLGTQAMCKNQPISSMISVQVEHVPNIRLKGCEALLSFYNEVRDSLLSQLKPSIQTLENNIGTQSYINELRNSIESAQIDAFSVKSYCMHLKDALNIKRNIFHAYLQAWGNMQFPTPSRRLRATTN